METFDDWIGREERAKDIVTASPIRALAATLDRNDPVPRRSDPLPPLWHWLYFLPMHPMSELGPDGHVKLGEFLPPVPLPHRMWAGSRLEFHHPLHVGDEVERVSRIQSVVSKQGRMGPLVFVVVRHEIVNSQGLAIEEEHDIVYRDQIQQAPPAPLAPQESAWRRTVHPNEVLLFRYSALTFNGHRIHYDRRYCTETAGYPGLVVHGPLTATLLLDLLRRNVPEQEVAQFSFRAVSPLFDTADFSLCGLPDGQEVHLWAATAQGGLAMEAKALLR